MIIKLQSPVPGGESPATELRIMPFLLVRIAGLPVEYGCGLPGQEASAIAAQLRRVDQQLRQLGPPLVEALFAAVSHPDAAPWRRPLLQAKRQAFAGAELAHTDELMGWLKRTLPASFDLYRTYQQTFQARSALQTQMDVVCAADQEATQHLLQRALAQPAFLSALGLANPRLLAQLQLPLQVHSRKRRKQLERTLLAFTLRAAMKVSPFSSFASTCQAKLNVSRELGHFDGQARTLHGESRLNRSVAVALRALLGESRLVDADKLQLSLNPSLSFLRDEKGPLRPLRAHLREYQLRRGTLWSEENLLNARLDPALCALLQSLPEQFSQSWLLLTLQQVEQDRVKAERLLRQLLRKDILRPLPQWRAHDDAPALILADALQTHPQLAGLAGRLRDLDGQARAFAHGPAQQRPGMLSSIETAFAQMHHSLGSRPPPKLAGSVYEDVRSEGIELVFGTRFTQRTLRRIAEVIGRHAVISTEYLWLRERFVASFGEGGCCTDLEGFLRAVWPAYLALGQQVSAGNVPRPRIDPLQGAALRLPITVYFQLATDDPDEALNGTPRLVINGAYPRAAWQLGRSVSSEGVTREQRETPLRDWLAEAHRPLEPVTVTVSGESSNLQSQPVLSERQLCLDEQPSQPSDWLLKDLQLAHNVSTGLLELSGPERRPVALQYLGGASPLPAWGIKYLLTVLAEPVQLSRPDLETVSAGVTHADVRHQPRLEENGCVLVRETWWLRSRKLLERLENLGSGDRLCELLSVSAEHGMPEEVFVNGEFEDFFSWKSFAAAKTRKPFWCRLSNVACVDYLLGLARDTDWLVFREALPAPAESWFRIDGQPHVTELHAEMVLVGGHMANGWKQ
jgi:hypothetical protein